MKKEECWWSLEGCGGIKNNNFHFPYCIIGSEKVAGLVANDSYGPSLSFDTSSASIMFRMAEKSLLKWRDLKVHLLQNIRPNYLLYDVMQLFHKELFMTARMF
jgi:hypothetical protein